MIAAVLAAACVPAHAEASMLTGMGDQHRALFDAPAFQALEVRHVRVVVPWDAALTDDQRAREWLETALARGMVPLVAFERTRGMECPGPQCAGPSPAAFEAAVAAFRVRWPQVTEVIPWNEPNHKSQPTHTDPALAAEYYNAARRACSTCTLVAGDLLDDVNLLSWLAAYRRGLGEAPAVWGLHNYYDATYFSSQGVDTYLDRLPGEVWLTETGGIVRFSPPGGGGLAYDETRAADGIRWLYEMTRSRPRVTRMYLYHWHGSDQADFDAGLLNPDGTARPGLAMVRAELASRRAAAAPGGAGGGQAGGRAEAIARGPRARVPVRVRLSGKSLRLVGRGLRVGVACVSAPARCRGRVVVKLPRVAATAASLRLSMRFDLRPGQSVTRALAATRATRGAIRRQRRLQVAFCLQGAKSCRTEYRPVYAR